MQIVELDLIHVLAYQLKTMTETMGKFEYGLDICDVKEMLLCVSLYVYCSYEAKCLVCGDLYRSLYRVKCQDSCNFP